MGNPRRQMGPFNFESAEDHPQFVSAAARALTILRCFDHGEQFLGNQEIALRTGLPKPTVSRLTFTLAAQGYLSYSQTREQYALGVALLSMGHGFVQCQPVIGIAQPLLERFAAQTGSVVMMGAPDGMRMVVLAIASPPDRSFADLELKPGARVPHGLTALGRADLAARREELFDQELKELRKDCQPLDWPRVRAGILKARLDVQQKGYCFSLGEWRSEVYAVGVPMVGKDPDRIIAFSCGGCSTDVSAEDLHKRLGPALVALRDAVLKQSRGVF
jgi:DNA-binding IclR family transcriptional regulator